MNGGAATPESPTQIWSQPGRIVGESEAQKSRLVV
jgi:hypothetical protein